MEQENVVTVTDIDELGIEWTPAINDWIDGMFMIDHERNKLRVGDELKLISDAGMPYPKRIYVKRDGRWIALHNIDP